MNINKVCRYFESTVLSQNMKLFHLCLGIVYYCGQLWLVLGLNGGVEGWTKCPVDGHC